MGRIFLGFLAVFSYKFIANITRMAMAGYYRDKYLKYLSGEEGDFAFYSHSVKKLLRAANVEDSTISVCEPVGYGQLLTGQTSLFENMSVKRHDVAAIMLTCLSKAEGTFRTRILECFSPLYWIEGVIFLPQKLISFLGLDEDSVLSKLLQLAYWIAAPLLICFRAELYAHIAELLGKMQ